MSDKYTDQTLTGTTVVAHFADGESAHRAILELRDMGFDTSTIGAAFHSNPGGGTNEHFDTIGKVGSHFEAAGATSDTSAVTPSGLATGAGSTGAGASRPGPIPGGGIPSTLPHSIPSTIPSTLHPESVAPNTAKPISAVPAATGVRADWSDRLNPIFSSEPTSSSRKPVADPAKEARKDEKAAVSAAKAEEKSKSEFGTGQGRLGLEPVYHPYSGAAFETSFSNMGATQSHARRVSQELSRGGAVVTVNAGSRLADAEQIIGRHNGVIRYEEGNAVTGESAYNATPARMELFGEMRRAYPLDPEAPVRKAS
ncbi:hypothetical protein [Silvibacterium acidisoli]|uniref:hypothetical protein n=1 Tax=Acidobacteriaceae bacterium ZG23-2 TaxID=2883246 RepID=UPI00406C7516